MKHLFATAALCLTASIANAEQRPVVVELFTSQGCSSCPPADAMLAEINTRSDVIAIALHVDYWDYIGWKDSFGDPAHTQRQRAYAAAAGQRSIYTPELVVNGTDDIVGAQAMKLAEAITAHAMKPQMVSLSAVRIGSDVQVSATALGALEGPFDVHVVGVRPSAEQKITRGENKGKTIIYSNIAHSWTVAGTWDGTFDLDLTVPAPSDAPLAILIQGAGAGPIVAAAKID